jgi:hypothetical protein
MRYEGGHSFDHDHCSASNDHDDYTTARRHDNASGAASQVDQLHE